MKQEQQKRLINDTTVGLVIVAGIIAAAAWRDWGRALITAGGMALVILLYQTDWAANTWEETRPLRMQLLVKLRAMWTSKREDADETVISIYDAFLGFSERTGKAIIRNLADMGHVFIMGTSQYGKTRLIYGVIYHLLANHDPDELQVAFADAKRVSYEIFSRVPHLRWPIARNPAETAVLLQEVKKEMDRRIQKFSIYAGKRICTNLREYKELSGEQIPRLVVIIDETADLIRQNSDTEKDLESLTKMGLAYGITLVLATQRPTAKGASQEAQSQTDSIFCTYMKNSTEYGSVARIPKAAYSKMTPSPGRFMVYIPKMAPVFLDQFPESEGWGFMRSQLIPNREIERLAQELSGNRSRMVWEQIDLEPVTAETKRQWGGDEAYKLSLIHEIAEALGRTPTAVELRERIDIRSRKTSEVWMQKYRERYE